MKNHTLRVIFFMFLVVYSVPCPGVYASPMHMREDTYTLAVSELEKEIADNPSDSSLHVELGWVHRNAGHIALAKQSFLHAAELTPDSHKAYDGLGWCYLDERNFNHAETALKKAIELYPDNYGTLIGLWHCYQHNAMYTEGERLLQNALALAPTSDWVYFELGVCYLKQKRYDKAEKMLTQAITINPQNHRAYFELGACYRALKQRDKSEEMFTQAFAYEVGSLLDVFNQKVVSLENTRYAEEQMVHATIGFEESFNALLARDMDNEQLLASIAWLYRYQGRYKKAVPIFKRLIDLGEAHARICEGFAWCLRALDREEEAREWFEKAIESDPHNDGAYLGLGLYYFAEKDYHKSEEFLKKSLSLNPENWHSKRVLQYCAHTNAVLGIGSDVPYEQS